MDQGTVRTTADQTSTSGQCKTTVNLGHMCEKQKMSSSEISEKILTPGDSQGEERV